MLGLFADAALLVVRSGTHAARPAERAKAMLEQSGSRSPAWSSTPWTTIWRTGRATHPVRASANPSRPPRQGSFARAGCPPGRPGDSACPGGYTRGSDDHETLLMNPRHRSLRIIDRSPPVLIAAILVGDHPGLRRPGLVGPSDGGGSDAPAPAGVRGAGHVMPILVHLAEPAGPAGWARPGAGGRSTGPIAGTARQPDFAAMHALHSVGVLPELARTTTRTRPCPSRSQSRTPASVDRPATLRWLLGALGCLTLFCVVAHDADRLDRTLLVWGSVVAPLFLFTSFGMIQLLGGADGLYGAYRPGKSPSWAPRWRTRWPRPAIVS